ncbi:MAG: DNA polymerase III subunit beta [Robiginitomaculum sp.]|nr:MAG: DNA polymerase III subunit beta [Robiginitomaculum sp.]
MKLNIERADLLKALNHVQSVVERRNTIPILSNVLISAKGDQLSFTATDLDIEIVESIGAQITEEGTVTAPAHTFYEIVRKLPEGAEVELIKTAEDPRLIINAGRSRFSLPSLPEDEFPVLSADGLNHSFAMRSTDLVKLIDKTRFAVSTEETRYYLNGIHLHAVEGDSAHLRAVATDGHRLALAEIALPEGAAGMSGIIIPRKTVQEVRRLLDAIDEDIAVSVSEAKIRFGIGAATLTSKLIDGSFPEYERVIPRGNEHTLKIERDIFAAAVDRVATISAEKSRSVKMTLEADTLTLTVNNPEAGLAVEELSVDYEAEPMEIGFNARYLLDILGQIESDEAVFRFADSASPSLVEDNSDTGALYVLMPLRV